MAYTQDYVLTSVLSEILKKDIAPMVDNQLENETYLLNKIPKDKRNGFANNVIYQTVRTGRNEGIASLSASATTLPQAGRQHRSQAQVAAAYIYGNINIDDRAIEESSSTRAAIIAALTDETDNLKKDIAKDMNRQLFGDGTGKLATVAASSTSTLITVDSVKYIVPNQKLTINGDAVQVVDVISATTFTVTAAVTVATNETAVKTDGSADMNGLFLAADDTSFTTTFEGINASTNWWWKSYVNSTAVTHTDAVIMEDLMRTAKTEVDKYGRCSQIITSFELFNKYKRVNVAAQRFVNTMKLDGGFGEAVMFDNIPVVADIDCQIDTMYFIDWDAISLEKLAPLQFMDRGISGVLLPLSGTTLNQATMKYYGNLLCGKRRGLAKLTNQH